MLRHAATGAVLVVIGLLITLFFSTRSHKPQRNAQVELQSTIAAYKQCNDSLVALSSGIAQALTDDEHRNERLAQVMRPVEHECTEAEAAIRDALANQPGDKRLTRMRDRNALGQQWLRQLSAAIAAYEVAAKTGSASQELATLQSLLK